jgi:hypothetical protein
MLAVIAHGDDAFRLVDTTGRDVGWVRPSTIGFSGFVSENAARGAALDGARALIRCLKREFGVAHMELSDRPRARTVRDGSGEWVADGKTRVARLFRVENGGYGQELAIEFRLPPYANHAVAINAAQIVYGALGRELTGTSGPGALQAAYDAVRQWP